MSADDLFWTEDPLPVSGAMSYDNWKTTEPDPYPLSDQGAGKTGHLDRCEQCWKPSYASVPGHVFCREHMLEHQQQAIAALVASAARSGGRHEAQLRTDGPR